MKSIFYGKTKLRYVHFDSHDMNHKWYKFTCYCYPHISHLEHLIKELEKYRDDENYSFSNEWIFETYIMSSDWIQLMERDRPVVLEVREEVTVGDKKGRIESRRYDVETNTWHYYTDITAKINNEHFESSKRSATTSMIDLINRHLVRFKEWDEMAKLNIIAREEQEQTFIGKIIKWFKG